MRSRGIMHLLASIRLSVGLQESFYQSEVLVCILTLYTSSHPQQLSNSVYNVFSIVITCSGVAVEQIAVKPTKSENNMLTESTFCGETVSPGKQFTILLHHCCLTLVYFKVVLHRSSRMSRWLWSGSMPGFIWIWQICRPILRSSKTSIISNHLRSWRNGFEYSKSCDNFSL